ncbi:MAG: META domain-containing protein [Odoribacter sp.]|nr:META domain-containing protein [Odoribacter sp.]
MKHLFISALAAATIASTATSCSMFKPKSSTTVKGSSATLVVYPSGEVQGTVPPEAVTGGEPGPVIPQTSDSHAVSQGSAETTGQSALAPRIAGQWNIIEADNITIDRDDMPYITFEPSTGKFYANDGCNTINGSYKIDGNDNITFYGVLSTMKLCPDVTFADAIGTALSGASPWKLKIQEIAGESFLSFLTTEGKQVMRVRRGSLDFLNGNWKVESIAGVEKLEVPADIFFDLAELKVHGNTGCNYFNGQIYLDHRAGNAIDFSNMGLTRMACPYSSQETAMMVALEQTASAIEGSPDQVMLLDSNGKELMTLSRLPIGSEE